MNKQKKPLYFYYMIILVVILLLNFLLPTFFPRSNVTAVDYNTFMTAIENKQVDEVEIGNEEINYTLTGEENQIYTTARVEDDSGLVQRLFDAGASFNRVYPTEMNPFLVLIISYVLPIVILWAVGSWLFKRMQKKMGNDSMSFGGGFGGGFGKSGPRSMSNHNPARPSRMWPVRKRPRKLWSKSLIS